MFVHFLKIAFRNMWKYKSRTLISVIGLAVGFTCFALATLWIRYEMTYDSFHKNAKQMYVVYVPDLFSHSGYKRTSPKLLASYLIETFPEIAKATPVTPSRRGDKIRVEDAELPAFIISVDSSFFGMFDVKILEGSRDFLITGSQKLAITQEKARQLFGNENPIGKKINGYEEICAVVSGMSKRSSFAFDFIRPLSPGFVSSGNPGWKAFVPNTIIELFPGTNIESFEKKLYEHEISANYELKKMTIKPLTKLRYIDPDIEREVQFQHILIFAIAGSLVILCSLFNYLTLFISRCRIRQKEFALRLVSGASGSSLLAMLLVEFILTLLIAVVLGCLLTQWLHRPFLTLAEIQMNLSAIYGEALLYIGAVMLAALLIFRLIVFIFRRRSINLSIRQSNKKPFRIISVIIQLVISIGFAFCTIIILKQIYFLHHTDELGFSFKNRGTLRISTQEKIQGSVWVNHLKQIPEITEVVDATEMTSLLPPNHRANATFESWDDKPADATFMSMEGMIVSPEYMAFYDFQLLAGEMLTDADADSLVLLNESAVHVFGWHEPVGKHFAVHRVKGVIRNVYHFAPIIPDKPTYCMKPKPRPEMESIAGVISSNTSKVIFKYREGTWKACQEKIERMIEQIKKSDSSLSSEIYNAEEEYNKFLKSENTLIKLLSLLSAICLLICVFGFVSLVSLTCEERRKSIAIRKINGATAGDILAIFAKEYFLLLIVGAVIAFSIGFFIMQRWLEHYVKQTDIPAWIYLSILFVMALVIILCVGRQVYKTSVENPAEVVKKDN